MTRYAVYPGSFNPWHEGHEDILNKALKVFDRVIIARGLNPEKGHPSPMKFDVMGKFYGFVELTYYDCLLKDFIKRLERRLFARTDSSNAHVLCAVVRGLRNGHDLLNEMQLQYWNEDLGVNIPTVYFACDRNLVHISSSAIRQVEKFDA